MEEGEVGSVKEMKPTSKPKFSQQPMVEDKEGGEWDRTILNTKDRDMLEVPKIEEDLWNHVRHVREGGRTYLSTPFLEFEVRSLQMDQHLDTKYLYTDKVSVPFLVSIHEDLAKLPDYQGEYEARLEVKLLPSTRGAISKERDTQNLLALLSTPIKCVLTFGELLKARTHLGQDLDETLKKLGVKDVDKQ